MYVKIVSCTQTHTGAIPTFMAPMTVPTQLRNDGASPIDCYITVRNIHHQLDEEFWYDVGLVATNRGSI